MITQQEQMSTLKVLMLFKKISLYSTVQTCQSLKSKTEEKSKEETKRKKKRSEPIRAGKEQQQIRLETP